MPYALNLLGKGPLDKRAENGRFAPLDLPGNDTLRPLFDRYKIPAAFISERLHNVAYGSGSQTCSDGFHSESLFLISSRPSLRHTQKGRLIASILVSLSLQEH